MSELKREISAFDIDDAESEISDPTNVDDRLEIDGGDSGSGQTKRPRMEKFRRRRSGKRRKRRITLAVLPTMLTLGNAVCGMAAIAIIMSTALDWSTPDRLFAGGLLIFGGMLFDALDGSAARLTNSASEFGAELDSLCDAITFGAVPAVIVWRISDALPQRLTFAIGVLFTLCVLIRLARFNVETDEGDAHEGFEGLPSPAAAGAVAAFAIGMPDLQEFATDTAYTEAVNTVASHALVASHYVIPGLALALAFLMVSRFQYPHIVSQWVRGRRPPHQIGQALFAVFSIFWLHWLALPILFCYFAFASPVNHWLKRGKTADPEI